jgi:adenine-specific DNA-methyltransferase
MMYPRLMLARDLLSEEGLIFVSIDANELVNVKSLLDEVFGESSLQGLVSRVTGTPTGGGNKALVGEVDYIAIYASGSGVRIEGVGFTEKDAAIYDKEDSGGRYLTRTLRRTGGEDRREDRPTMYYPIEAPDGSVILPKGPTGYDSRWICGEARFHEMKRHGLIEFIDRGTSSHEGWQVHQKFYLEGRRKQPSDFWSNIDGNKKGTREVKSIFDSEKVFTNPKPVALISRIIEISDASDGDLVVDFFAGSGTTGHAVMAQNAKDGCSRRYIVVQLPEPLDDTNAEQKAAAEFCDKLGKPRTIVELTKERLRRAGEKVRADSPGAKIDTGFRVYKLATSNLKPWQPGGNLAADLLDATSNVLPGRSEDDLLTELLLKTGIDLALPAETRTICECTVHSLGGGTLIVCLADIGAAQARALGDGIADWLADLAPPGPTTFFFKDSGFDASGNRAAEARSNLAATLRQRRGDDAIEKLGAI